MQSEFFTFGDLTIFLQPKTAIIWAKRLFSQDEILTNIKNINDQLKANIPTKCIEQMTAYSESNKIERFEYRIKY